MRHHIFIFLLAIIGIGAVIGVATIGEPEKIVSVEIGAYGVSPNGEEGGYAVPASGSSYSCSLQISPNPIPQGSTVTLNWTGTDSYSMPSMTVVRGSTNLGNHSTGWVDTGAAALAPGTYTYSLQYQTSYQQCYQECSECGVTCQNQSYTVTACSSILTINSTKPDLVSLSLGMEGGGSTITIDEEVAFEADARNTGTVSAGAFIDTFSYSYDGEGGTFMPISSSSAEGLSPGATVSDASGGIIFGSPGTVTIRHCVDSAEAVDESSESNNCSYQSYTVVHDGFSVSCTASPDPADLNEEVVWSAAVSGGTSPYSYDWSGDDGLVGNANPLTVTYGSFGTKDAAVRVIDSLGLQSGKVACNTLQVGDLPTAELEMRAQGSGDWSGGPVNITDADELELRWNSTNADSCSGSRFIAAGATAGQTSNVNEPPAGEYWIYRVTCTDSESGLSAWDAVRVNNVSISGDPIIDVSPGRVRQGDFVSISGDVNGHTECSIVGNDEIISLDGVVGSFNFPASSGVSGEIVGETTFTLSCASFGGSVSDTVRISPLFEEV